MIVQMIVRVNNFKGRTACMEKRKTDRPAPDMSGCRGCRHYFEAADPVCYRQSIPACEYILDTGMRRPCPAGADCTEYRSVPRGMSAYRRRHNAIIEAFIGARRRR